MTTQNATAYRWMIVALLLVLVVLSLLPIQACLRHGSTKDYKLWYETGQLVLHGEGLYPANGDFPFMYPPLAAFLLAPLSLGGPLLMIIALELISSVAWLASILLSVYLVTGKVFNQKPLLYVLPALVTLPYLWDIYYLGQVNLVLLALMLGAFACLKHERGFFAGGLIALATAIKAFPILAIGYLIYRRHWKAVAGTLLFLGVFFLVIPVAVRGVHQGMNDVHAWVNGMVLRYDTSGLGQRPARFCSWKNHSLLGLANRLLRRASADGEDGNVYLVNIANLDFKTMNAILMAVALGMGLFYISVMPPKARCTAQHAAIEYAMLLILILLFSPYSFGYFFIWLLYPFTLIVHLWLEVPGQSREASLLATLFSCVLFLLALSLIWERDAQAYGNHASAGLILFGILSWQLLKMRRPRRASMAELGLAPTFGRA